MNADTKMPCEECVRTKHHCCEAVVPFSKFDIELLKHLAEEQGIQDIVISKSSRVRGFYNINTLEQLQNLSIESNCIFFKEGLCSIYDNRPSICRTFCTSLVPCGFFTERWEPEQPLPLKGKLK